MAFTDDCTQSVGCWHLQLNLSSFRYFEVRFHSVGGWPTSCGVAAGSASACAACSSAEGFAGLLAAAGLFKADAVERLNLEHRSLGSFRGCDALVGCRIEKS